MTMKNSVSLACALGCGAGSYEIGARDPFRDEAEELPTSDRNQTAPAVQVHYEILFVDREGEQVDETPPSGPIEPNHLSLLEIRNGSVTRLTSSRIASELARFAPSDPRTDPVDDTIVFYDALSQQLRSLAQGGETVVLLSLPGTETPKALDVDLAGHGVICQVNEHGVGQPVRTFRVGGGQYASLDETIRQTLVDGAFECQLGADGSLYALTGIVFAQWCQPNEPFQELVKLQFHDNGSAALEKLGIAGTPVLEQFDVSPDGTRFAFVDLAEESEPVSWRSLDGLAKPTIISEPSVAPVASGSVHHSPRWCDDSHIAWQTLGGGERTIWLADLASGKREAIWRGPNRLLRSAEASLDCRRREIESWNE